MQISCQPAGSSAFPQYGQGCEDGDAAWVEVDPLQARPEANEKGATGYYRPEDLHQDPVYDGPGYRWCYANTGNIKGNNPGEVMCVVDPEPEGNAAWTFEGNGFRYQSTNGSAPLVAVVRRFIQGGARFNAHDNLAFNPTSGHLYVIKDQTYGEIWACLKDSMDQDFESDGCIPVLSVTDPNAEPTGFEFDAMGTTTFVHIQHGECPDELKDFRTNPDGGCTDDLLKITGFKAPRGYEKAFQMAKDSFNGKN